MGINQINKLEKAVVFFLNFDNWDLKWVGDQNKPYDAIGKTPKGYPCVIEMKFRDKYYEKKLLEKEQAKYIDEFYKDLPPDARENYEYYTS